MINKSFFPPKLQIANLIRFNAQRAFSTKKNESIFDEGEQVAMADARRMVQSIEEAVVELKTYNDWVPVVMKSKIPVIIDGYAEWCNPCQKLTPILEEKAIEANGKFKLVKVNIDLLPEIASGLSVRSIPAVFLVKDGNVMDTFTGLPSDERIQDFINTAKLLEQLSHDEKTIDQVILAAEDHIKSEDYYSASEIFRQAMVTANFTEEQHGRMLLNTCLCYAKMGNELEAKEFYLKWHNKFKNHKLDDTCQLISDKYKEAMEEIKLKEGEDEKLIELQNQLDNDPQNCEIMFALANRLLEKEKYDLAINYCVDIIAIDRNWNNSAAHKVLLEVFNKLGTNHEIVKEGRKKLTRVLF